MESNWVGTYFLFFLSLQTSSPYFSFFLPIHSLDAETLIDPVERARTDEESEMKG